MLGSLTFKGTVIESSFPLRSESSRWSQRDPHIPKVQISTERTALGYEVVSSCSKKNSRGLA